MLLLYYCLGVLMSQYVAFTEQDAIRYVQKNTTLFNIDDSLTCYEFGDGNLNMVFRVSNQAGQSIILKQALPYARCVGESWPLTLDRARIEAEALLAHSKVSPGHTAKVIAYNPELALMLLEDLGHMQILRTAQNQGQHFPLLGQHMAHYFANTAFYHSDFYLTAQRKKALVAQFINPELCQITEDLFLTDPFVGHERNNYPAELEPEVSKLQSNTSLRLAVAKLKSKFLSCPQTLLHGDVHSGSIFVDQSQTKLIDPEFAFFGPIGFDLGSFIGNLLINYCAQTGRMSDETARQTMQQHLLETLNITTSGFVQQFTELAAQHCQDISFADATYQQAFLQQVLQDAIGYSGCELIRRTIGLAHTSDIDTISDEKARLAVQQRTLVLGQALILNAQQVTTSAQLAELLHQHLN